MRAAFVIFDRMTALDFIGVYDPLTRLRTMGLLPGFEWATCAATASLIDDRGLRFVPDLVNKTLEQFDLLVVPGGPVTRTLQNDAGFLKWLRTAEHVPLKAAVGAGSFLLGAAGILAGTPAATHPTPRPLLSPSLRELSTRRVVDGGSIVTARGGTPAIDLGLHLVERLAGEEARRRVARQMGYPTHADQPRDFSLRSRSGLRSFPRASYWQPREDANIASIADATTAPVTTGIGGIPNA